jgi:hypothetical protein
MDRPRLALQDHPVDGAELSERRQLNVANLGTERLQGVGNLFQPGCHLRIGRQIGYVKVPDKTDPQPPDPALQPGRIMPVRRAGAAGIKRIVAGDDTEHQRVVGDRARHRSDVIKREGQR